MNALRPPEPDISVSLNLKAILGALAALTPLVVGLTMVLQIRQDVRENTRHQVMHAQAIRDLEARVAEVERAKLTYCISRAADTSTVRSAPDAGC